MPPTTMDYAELNATYPKNMANVTMGDYVMFGFADKRDVFAEFYKTSHRTAEESSWKCHVSVLTTHLDRAWDIIHPILVAAGVHHFKVARQSALMAKGKKIAQDESFSENERAMGLNDIARLVPGMQITIYIRQGKEKEIQAVFKNIEKALKKDAITPGEIDQSDRALGRYVSIRNDGGPLGYQSHDLVSSYNPTGEKDPFKAL